VIGLNMGSGFKFKGSNYKKLHQMVSRLRPGRKMDNFSDATRGSSVIRDILSTLSGSGGMFGRMARKAQLKLKAQTTQKMHESQAAQKTPQTPQSSSRRDIRLEGQGERRSFQDVAASMFGENKFERKRKRTLKKMLSWF